MSSATMWGALSKAKAISFRLMKPPNGARAT
jgi:hypothetical protein